MALTPKERMKIERQKMPERDPNERNLDFNEVNLGFPEELAVLEAARCLHVHRRLSGRHRYSRFHGAHRGRRSEEGRRAAAFG
jgi:hypothetical protein